MGKKIAILVGVANYDYETSLPPCEKDLAMMTSIIRNTNKFDEYLVVGNSPKGGDAKSQIASFIRKYENTDIDEVFFYYTGHGTRDSGDFLFVFSDFIKDKIEQTSLRNTELDSMLKSLSPGIAIKVVDACQAGTEYIKSGEDLEEILKKSSSLSFKKTYFFFSSSSSESSIAVPDYSIFTKSFADAIVSYSGKAVRYRDLMAYISDDTKVTSRQTPLFIQQASNTEVFCDVSEDLTKAIIGAELTAEKEEEHLVESTQPEVTLDRKLIDVIKSKAAEYCSEEEATNSLMILTDTIVNHRFGSILDELYEIEITLQNSYSGFTGIKSIGKWLSEEKEPYFAKVISRQEEYEAKEKVELEEGYPGLFGSAYSMSRMLGGQRKYEYKNVTKYRDVIEGIQLTATSPCCAIDITLSPKEQNLPWYKAFVIFVFSKSRLVLFYKNEKQREISWNQRETLNSQEWKTVHCSLKKVDDVRNAAITILSKIEEGIVSELASAFGVK